MIKKFIHIGYPKNFSTSLQRDFFSVHPDLYHLGIGVGSNIGYIDDISSSLFEVFLKSSKEFHFETFKNQLKNHIDEHFQNAIEQKKSCFTASSEHLVYSYLPESIDFETKLKRIIYLLGDDINIIFVIRNQRDLIKSLYKEFVRSGMPYSFPEFIYNLYKFQDRNLYYDLRYDLIFQKLLEYLPKENIHILKFESYKNNAKNNQNSKKSISNDLCEIMKISKLNRRIKHFNKALTENELVVKQELNKANRHDLGNGLFESAETHRQERYFSSYLKLGGYEDFFKDVKLKRRIIEASKLDLTSYEEVAIMDFFTDINLEYQIFDFYNQGNKQFEEITGMKLSSEYFKSSFT